MVPASATWGAGLLRDADMTDTATAPALPKVVPISTADLRAALSAGLSDIARAPLQSLFFGIAFSILGVAIARLLVVVGSSYWVLPLAAGFPLIGPFAAIGLYEISRRLEEGEPVTWGNVLGAVWRSSRSQIASYAFVTVFVFLAWAWLAHLIFALFVGLAPPENTSSAVQLMLSTEGISMLIVGTIVGGALATILFCISVVSVPLLLDRDIDIVSAMVTSVKAVLVSQKTMIVWGLVITALCVLAMLPMFIGMIAVFPLLGHASWHLYRRAVPRD